MKRNKKIVIAQKRMGPLEELIIKFNKPKHKNTIYNKIFPSEQYFVYFAKIYKQERKRQAPETPKLIGLTISLSSCIIAALLSIIP
jgi:hypothetical protein